ncbi:DUF2975 domain-containing protein [Brachybacterium huguangmaarense]
MSRLLLTSLRGIILIGALFCLVAMGFLPLLAFAIVDGDPAFTPYLALYISAAELALVCVPVSLVSLWRLLTRVRDDRIFEPDAFRGVDVIIGAAALATALTAGVVLHSWIFHVPGHIVPTFLLILLGLAGLGFVLTMLVMRSLLLRATQLRTEMAEVI